MTEVTQVPGSLDIKAKKGDDLSILIDFSIDMTGYTFEAGVNENEGNVTPITVANTNLPAGQITISL